MAWHRQEKAAWIVPISPVPSPGLCLCARSGGGTSTGSTTPTPSPKNAKPLELALRPRCSCTCPGHEESRAQERPGWRDRDSGLAHGNAVQGQRALILTWGSVLQQLCWSHWRLFLPLCPIPRSSKNNGELKLEGKGIGIWSDCIPQECLALQSTLDMHNPYFRYPPVQT